MPKFIYWHSTFLIISYKQTQFLELLLFCYINTTQRHLQKPGHLVIKKMPLTLKSVKRNWVISSRDKKANNSENTLRSWERVELHSYTQYCNVYDQIYLLLPIHFPFQHNVHQTNFLQSETSLFSLFPKKLRYCVLCVYTQQRQCFNFSKKLFLLGRILHWTTNCKTEKCKKKDKA